MVVVEIVGGRKRPRRPQPPGPSRTPAAGTCTPLGPFAVGIEGVTPVPVVYFPNQDHVYDTPPAFACFLWSYVG